MYIYYLLEKKNVGPRKEERLQARYRTRIDNIPERLINDPGTSIPRHASNYLLQRSASYGV